MSTTLGKGSTEIAPLLLKLALLVLAGMLAACSSAVAEPPLVNPWATNKSPTRQLYGKYGVVLSKRCGNAEMQVSCPPSSQANPFGCLQTKLTLTEADGRQHEIARPKEIARDNFTAVGLACAPAKDGVGYFVVQYGELPFGCQMCEWLYVYDHQGRALTKSDPLLLTDQSLPSAEKKYPNNKEFNRLYDELGFGNFDIDYVICDRQSDDAGNAVCLLKF